VSALITKQTTCEESIMRTQQVPEPRVISRDLPALAIISVLTLLTHLPARAESPVDLINEAAARGDVTADSVRGSVSVLIGSGGNITVLEGSEGKLIVDGGIALSRPGLDNAFAKIGPGQPKLLINTHWHWDHADSNDWLHEAGATILAHPNTLKHLSSEVEVKDWQHTFEPLPVAARPTSPVRDHKTLDFGGEQVVIHYYGPAHTDGDLYVYFKHADVLATGDTYWNGIYPFIDYIAGGSIDGMIRAAEMNVALATAKTLVVPGHGPVATRADLVEYRDMLIEIRANVAALKGQGKTLQEAVLARPTAAFDRKWGQFVIDPAFFTRLVYRGV
jgi:glyoxylase-like metal-dependent hydrolase (beta-lactamase superfamily II)